MGQNNGHAGAGDLPAELLERLETQQGESLLSLASGRPLLLVLLRHSGCLFCRETLARVRDQRATIEARGVTIVLVHMGTESQGRAFFRQYGLEDLPRISDPERRLYSALDLGLASPGQLLSPSLWRRGLKLLLAEGHFIGLPRGNALQMPGTFLIRGTRILAAHRHRTAADSPQLEAVSACAIQ